ncbi:hypothetical protein HAL_31260 [Haladaptatus sp. T7]|nr:hypothetical protein HAL_31260 [Haladaptatus sp. T7]
MYKLFKTLMDAQPTARPRRMKSVNALFERVKPFFDEVSLGIVKVTAQPNSKEGSPIAVAINEKHRVREIVFLGHSRQKRSRLISPMPIKHCDIEQQFCFGVYCSVCPRLSAVEFDSGFVDRDPRRRCRRGSETM